MVVGRSAAEPPDLLLQQAARASTLAQLAALVRALRRRHARGRREGELTYRQLAERTGWSQTSIAEYFTARTLPPTDRFDVLLMELGATPGERGTLATARDRIEESRRQSPHGSRPPARGAHRAAALPPDAAVDDAAPAGHPASAPGDGAGDGAGAVVSAGVEVGVDVGVGRGGGGGAGSPVEADRDAEQVGPDDAAGQVPGPPRRLPPALPRFCGRLAQLAELDASMPGAAPFPGVPVTITAITGTAGIGKTALATHWAHRVADRFPDGQLYVNLRGFAPGGEILPPGDALLHLLDALAVPRDRVPADLDARSALYRDVISGRRMLLLLDNARDTAHVRPLLPGTTTCRVLVTSRNQLAGLVAAAGAQPLGLDAMTTAEARELLRSRVGADRVAAEPDAVNEIIDCCASLPLALAVIAARAAANRRFALAELGRELRESHPRLDALSCPHDPYTDVRTVFSWSYRVLDERSARMFRLLGLHPGPDISTAAASSLAALPFPTARAALTGLVDVGLLAEVMPGRFALRELIHAYSAELAHTADGEDDRSRATGRLLDHYLHSADRATRLLDPAREPFPLHPPRTGTAPEDPGTPGHALDWLATEYPVLQAVTRHAAVHGYPAHAWHLSAALTAFLDRRLTPPGLAVVGRDGAPARVARLSAADTAWSWDATPPDVVPPGPPHDPTHALSWIPRP